MKFISCVFIIIFFLSLDGISFHSPFEYVSYFPLVCHDMIPLCINLSTHTYKNKFFKFDLRFIFTLINCGRDIAQSIERRPCLQGYRLDPRSSPTWPWAAQIECFGVCSKLWDLMPGVTLRLRPSEIHLSGLVLTQTRFIGRLYYHGNCGLKILFLFKFPCDFDLDFDHFGNSDCLLVYW